MINKPNIIKYRDYILKSISPQFKKYVEDNLSQRLTANEFCLKLNEYTVKMMDDLKYNNKRLLDLYKDCRRAEDMYKLTNTLSFKIPDKSFSVKVPEDYFPTIPFPYDFISIEFDKYFITIDNIIDTHTISGKSGEQALVISLKIIDGYEKHPGIIFDFFVYSNLPNRCYISSIGYDCMPTCKYCNRVTIRVGTTIVSNSTIDACRCGKYTSVNCPRCTEFTPLEIFNIVKSVLYKFSQRRATKQPIQILNKPLNKNSTETDVRHISLSKEFEYVDLSTYFSTDRHIRRAISESRRESPVEHIRQSHYRHLKSGKVIEVKGCTVGKGNKKQIVYKM